MLAMYQKLQRLPFGNKLFSLVFARKAPYFGTINPQVAELRPNFCEVRFEKRRAVKNHSGTAARYRYLQRPRNGHGRISRGHCAVTPPLDAERHGC